MFGRLFVYNLQWLLWGMSPRFELISKPGTQKCFSFHLTTAVHDIGVEKTKIKNSACVDPLTRSKRTFTILFPFFAVVTFSVHSFALIQITFKKTIQIKFMVWNFWLRSRLWWLFSLLKKFLAFWLEILVFNFFWSYSSLRYQGKDRSPAKNQVIFNFFWWNNWCGKDWGNYGFHPILWSQLQFSDRIIKNS